MGVIPGAPHVAREGPERRQPMEEDYDETSDGGKPADTHDTTHHGVTPPPRYEPVKVACIETSMLCV